MLKNKILTTETLADDPLVSAEYHLDVEKYFPATAISGHTDKNRDSAPR